MKVALWLGGASSSYSISSKSITALRLGYNEGQELPKACVEWHVNRSSPQLACNVYVRRIRSPRSLGAMHDRDELFRCSSANSKESKEDLKILKISKETSYY